MAKGSTGLFQVVHKFKVKNIYVDIKLNNFHTNTAKIFIRNGFCPETMKKYTEAIHAYKKALEIDPQNKEAQDSQTRCLDVCFF